MCSRTANSSENNISHLVQISDMKQEHERRVETLLEDIKQLTKEMRLQELLINYTIPPEFQELIEKVTTYFRYFYCCYISCWGRTF